MKKRWIIIAAIILFIFPSMTVKAAPYESFVVDKDGGYRYSPSLYEPAYMIDYNLNGITDLYVSQENLLYVARTDAGHGEILIFDTKGNYIRSIVDDEMKSVKGIFVDPEGKVYAVDYSRALIHIFDSAGQLLKSIGKPEDPLYGNTTPFKPTKVVADKQGNLYIVSEGTTNGIIQLNAEGEFLGYFGANLTQSTLIHELQKRFFSEEMLDFFIKSVPQSMSNIAIDDQGIVYATTKGDTEEPLKKLNIAGKNLLTNSIPNNFYGKDKYLNFVSVAVDPDGNMIALSATYGQIFLFDKSGSNIGICGAKNEGGNNELGITTNPIAVGVDAEHRIYIGDAQGNVQVLTPTPFMKLIYEALVLYNDGRYMESKELWEEVLVRNSSIAIANKGLGHSYYKQQDYASAMDYFKRANDRTDYSNAFWEIRQQFLLDYVGYFILGVFVLSILGFLKKMLRKYTKVLEPFDAWKAKCGETRVMIQIRNVLYCIKHPRDVFYELRFNNTIAIGTSAALIGIFLILKVGRVYTFGFLFNKVTLIDYTPIQDIVNVLMLMGLFVISNYLVASIKDGEGKLIQVLKGFTVSLTPAVLLLIPLGVISNVLTLQEIFIFQFLESVIYIWCFILIFCMIMEIHDYTVRETVVNLLLTVFVMMVIFVVAVVISILGKEFIGFIKSIVEEVMSRG
jgi:DNA-binding beta-propeller fold protein YncE